ncbi:unnamed protein product [Orchesella dallaii]|uniref:Uncharacterized protein n=1 Tax=Orchesella dallaii TaxID=48710 RepID=A0ABP1QV37_9HEXA
MQLKMSQSGTFYKIIVTCVLLGVNVSLSNASPQRLREGFLADNPLLQFAPTGEASSGLVASELSSASNLGINSEYNRFLEEGASPSTHPLLADYRQRGQYNRGAGLNSFSSPKDLQTAAQSYFIEPAQTTTSTARPSYKKRKTRRPISVLADKKKPVLEVDGFHNNEAPIGAPPFNPFRQIVNTSFGRKRPSSEGKQERTRSRAKPDVPSVDNKNESNESLNEIPSSTEGEPRALGRRRPAQDVRPISRPTTTFSSPTDNTDPPQSTRFTPRKPVDATNGPRARNFARRPRPTTTISSDDDGTETSQPPQLPRRKPLRPNGVSRFSTAANRQPGPPPPTTTDSPSDSDVAPAPPPQGLRRRAKRPTTTAQAFSFPPAPKEIIHAEISTSAPVTENAGDETLPSPPKREGRQGFILRPRPTQQVPPETETPEEESSGRQLTAQEIQATARPNLNRRRKRPTTTNGPADEPEFNHGFGGKAISNLANDVIPSNPPQVARNISPLRRTNLRGRPTQQPNAYQVREEQPNPQPISSGAFGNTEEFGRSDPTSQNNNSPANLLLMRRPLGPDSHSQGLPLMNSFSNDPSSMLDGNFVPGLFPISSPGNWYTGLDNGLGAVPGNFRTHSNQFSSRAASSADESEPEISDSDTSPSATSTEKQAVVSPPENSDSEAKKPVQKLSPLERLQSNRQAAARRFLTPKKPTEKPTPSPSSNQNAGKNTRKSLIPPRMLRPRGKLVEEKAVKADEGQENNSAGGEEKSKEEGGSGKETGSINDSNTSSSSTGNDETDSNVVPISPNPNAEEQETSSTKPSIFENAKRRRITLPGSRSTTTTAGAVGNQQKLKITPAPPPDHNPDAPSPNCENGQRYSKFLKRCVTMYKPRAQG